MVKFRRKGLELMILVLLDESTSSRRQNSAPFFNFGMTKSLGRRCSVAETVAIRGYIMTKHESTEILITKPGKYVVGKDGVIEKLE